MTALEVTTGHILALRLFDVAYAIDLAEAETLWARHAAGGSSRSRLTATAPKAMAFGVPPLAVVLDPLDPAARHRPGRGHRHRPAV